MPREVRKSGEKRWHDGRGNGEDRFENVGHEKILEPGNNGCKWGVRSIAPLFRGRGDERAAREA